MSEDSEQEDSYLKITKAHEDESNTFEWTFGKYLLLIELSFVLFFNFASFSVLASFFPIEVSLSIQLMSFVTLKHAQRSIIWSNCQQHRERI